MSDEVNQEKVNFNSKQFAFFKIIR